MKTFTVVVTVSLMLAFFCIQESCTIPITEGLELGEVLTDDGSLAVDQDMPEESWNMPYDSVHMRRRRRRRRCRFCCDCCPNESGCGTCCKF